VHPGRSARSHLRSMAATHNIKASRVSEVMEMTGLAGVATKRVAGFSLGMGQRLGITAALLGDPRTLILDEPVNGLDPEGVQWVRQLVRALAAEGRTVFLSSHLCHRRNRQPASSQALQRPHQRESKVFVGFDARLLLSRRGRPDRPVRRRVPSRPVSQEAELRRT
jgi:ABC-2 type transport system ATP-binding protein